VSLGSWLFLVAIAVGSSCTRSPREDIDERASSPFCAAGTVVSNAQPGSFRLVPEVRDGKASGWRFYSVSPESKLGQAGVRNGDVLLEKDGGLSQALRCLDGMTLRLRRGTEDVLIEYPHP